MESCFSFHRGETVVAVACLVKPLLLLFHWGFTGVSPGCQKKSVIPNNDNKESLTP
jgi:hypothetical protein